MVKSLVLYEKFMPQRNQHFPNGLLVLRKGKIILKKPAAPDRPHESRKNLFMPQLKTSSS